MESLSRVKKNAALRQALENSRESELASTALSPFADRLNRISPDLSSVEMSAPASTEMSRHAKGENEGTFEPYVSPIDPSFHHDYLNEFIDEVKHYNLKKGYAPAPQMTPPVSTPLTPPRETSVNADDDLTLEIKKAIRDDEPEFAMEPLSTSEDTVELVGVLEETAKIKVKLESVDKELLEMNRNVNRSTRALNVITWFLVVILLSMLGFAVYWILTTEGM
jgi:hypothetical protein